MRFPSALFLADLLPIPHAGELLASKFMDPLGLDCPALADAIAVDPAHRLTRKID